MKKRGFKSALPTIGFLINQLDGWYQAPIWRGITDIIEENDCNLIIFIGKSLDSPFTDDRFHNIVYQAANPDRLDGIILSAGSLANFINPEDFQGFVRNFRSVPMVSIAYPIEGIPSVMIDNKIGMKHIVSHIVNVHGRKNIAFIRGPETNKEANERYHAYLEALSEQGLTPDLNSIVNGNFRPIDGVEAVNQLLHIRKANFDAIIAANDDLALGASKALLASGIRIPEDVLLTGFDDQEEVRFLSPPLTTIRQPLYEQGRKAGEMILQLINGKEVPMRVYLPTEPVIRQSCGCSSPSISNFKTEFLPVESLLSQDNTPSNLVENMRLYSKSLKDNEVHEVLLSELAEAAQADLTKNMLSQRFINLLNKIIRNLKLEDKHLSYWIRALTLLRQSMINATDNEKLLSGIEEIFYYAQVLFMDIILSKDKQRRVREERTLWLLRDIVSSVSSAITLDKLKTVIENTLPTIRINSAFISLFNSFDQPGSTRHTNLPKESKLFIAYNENGPIIKDNNGVLFQTEDILPDEMIPYHRRYTLLIYPLIQLDEQFGLFFCELGVKTDVVYSILREQISNALQYIKILRDREFMEHKLQTTLLETQKNEERFHEMAMLLPTIIIETDINYCITFLNQAGYEVFQLDPSYASARQIMLTELVHPEEKEKLKQYCAGLFFSDKSRLSDFRFLKKDGSEISLIFKANPIYRDGNIIGIRWSAIDIKPLITSVITPDSSFFDKYRLTAREKEIALMMLQGYKSKEIAEKLFISLNTVKVHTGSIYEKMQVESKAGFFSVLKDYQVGRFGHDSFLYALISQFIKE